MTNYQISIETRVLQLLIRCQHIGDGIRWTTDTIAEHLHLPIGGVGLGLLNLMKIGYVWRGVSHQWFVTPEGRAAFSYECKDLVS